MTQYTVTAGRVNFRSAPMIADNIIATLKLGQIVEGSETAAGSGWLDVKTTIPNVPDDLHGFVKAELVVDSSKPADNKASTQGAPAIAIEQLQRLTPNGKAEFLGPLATNCVTARQALGLGVSPLYICHFLAQLAHESAGFRTMREFWGPTRAQLGYDGRRDLGNTQPGDGKRFMGRGYLQITGRANYGRYGQLIGQPLTTMPQLAEDPIQALNIACLYWKSRDIDRPVANNDIAEVTRRINGGHNGLAERTALFRKAMEIWG